MGNVRIASWVVIRRGSERASCRAGSAHKRGAGGFPAALLHYLGCEWSRRELELRMEDRLILP